MLALAPVLALLAASPSLVTESEQSGWVKTGRYSEVERLCRDFPRAYPGKVRCDRFGITPEGRPMLALAFSSDGTLTPEAAAKKHRPVVLFQGGIHAGEIDGKDAGFWLMREVLEGKALPGVLGKLTAVFVPVYNVDGHERFGKNQRPNQVGPEEMGWRVTAQNYNLNRDYTKADAPETRAMLALLDRWMPLLYLDLHVTDGAEFEHDVSVTLEPLHAGAENLRPLGQAMQTALFEKLTAQGHLPLGFYPSFRDGDDPASGFAVGVPPPRFSHGYWALRNRFGVLVETHSWKPYAHRVKTTRDVVEGLLALTAAQGKAWQEQVAIADAADRAASKAPIALGWKPTDASHPIDFRGYAYTRAPSELAGKAIPHYDVTRPQIWKVPLFDQLAPTATALPPEAGYLVPAAYAAEVGPLLALHGFTSKKLGAEATIAGETFRASAVTFGKTSYEGRQIAELAGSWKPESRAFPQGSLFVPANQPGRRLLVTLLEPASKDSFVSWGRFNAAFEQKEYIEDYVLEPWAKGALAKDPQLAAEFQKRLADPEFAKDPDARLRFFAERHPAWDARFNLYPIGRTAQSPTIR